RHTRSKRDWSSDVCSSDLDALVQFFAALKVEQDFAARHAESVAAECICREVSGGFLRLEDGCPVHAPLPRPNRDECPHCGGDGRSEERRVGKEGVVGWGGR